MDYGCTEISCLLLNNLLCSPPFKKSSDSSNNQAKRFGDLPCWAIELSNSIQEVALFGDQISESTDLFSRASKSSSVLPSNLLWREPLFDQLIVSLYQPGYPCTF